MEQYISECSEERREAISKLRETILENLDSWFEEIMSYGMIGYVVPHSIYPAGYHCTPDLPLPFINIWNQKNFVALYHCWLYAQKEIHDWFVEEYPKHCKYKLDMWKSCIRFKRLDDIPYELIWELIRKLTLKDRIEVYESVIKK